MGNLLFSMGGRINPADFQRGAIVLIAVGTVLKILPFFSMSLGMLAGLLGLILLWPWVALWGKRYHDSDQSAWRIIAPIIALVVLSMIAGAVINVMFPVDTRAAMSAAQSGDFMALLQGAAAAARHQVIPSALIGAVLQFGVVYVFNGMIKATPGDNKYGPAAN
ncbi:MAG: hypothetical protein COA85_06165 [Robiginitomaculum sp.]|nr:MAG: hypothetical protein COA85_06165 [Robiginitomaculum sp.]